MKKTRNLKLAIFLCCLGLVVMTILLLFKDSLKFTYFKVLNGSEVVLSKSKLTLELDKHYAIVNHDKEGVYILINAEIDDVMFRVDDVSGSFDRLVPLLKNDGYIELSFQNDSCSLFRYKKAFGSSSYSHLIVQNNVPATIHFTVSDEMLNGKSNLICSLFYINKDTHSNLQALSLIFIPRQQVKISSLRKKFLTSGVGLAYFPMSVEQERQIAVS